MSDEEIPPGVWVTCGWDMRPYAVTPWPDEVSALRHVNDNEGCGYRAWYVPFGAELDEVVRTRRRFT